jgi:hypothetical protein
MEPDRLEYNSDQRKTRRHCSLDRYNLDDNLLPSNADVEAEILNKERDSELHCAIAKLLPEQQRLICAYYFNGTPLAEIARRQNVSKQAISNRLARAEKALRKNYRVDPVYFVLCRDLPMKANKATSLQKGGWRHEPHFAHRHQRREAAKGRWPCQLPPSR